MHASIQNDLWPTVTVQGHSYYLSKCSFVNSKNNTTYRRMVIIVDECGTVGDELRCRRCLQKVISRSFGCSAHCLCVQMFARDSIAVSCRGAALFGRLRSLTASSTYLVSSSTVAGRALPVAGPSMWNVLPQKVHSWTFSSCFRDPMKTYIRHFYA